MPGTFKDLAVIRLSGLQEGKGKALLHSCDETRKCGAGKWEAKSLPLNPGLQLHEELRHSYLPSIPALAALTGFPLLEKVT